MIYCARCDKKFGSMAAMQSHYSAVHKHQNPTTATATKSDIDKMVEAVRNSSQTETLNDMSTAVKAITSAFRETQLALEQSRIALQDEKSRGKELEREVVALREIKKKVDSDEEQEGSSLKRYLSQYAGDRSMCQEDCGWCGRCNGKYEYAADYVQRQFQLVKEKLLLV
jgi:hypothetical protein